MQSQTYILSYVSNKDVLIECVKLFFLFMSKLNVSMWQDRGDQNDFSFGGQGGGRRVLLLLLFEWRSKVVTPDSPTQLYMMLTLFSSWIETQSCIPIPLNVTLKCYPYEQLSAICRLKLYAMFLNVQIILPFIEIGLVYRGSQQWLSCIVVVRFTGGGNRSTRRKNYQFLQVRSTLTSR